MSLDSIKEMLSGFENLPQLPDPSVLVGYARTIAKVLVVGGPAVMVIMGLLYLFAAPKEANHHFGYRCYFGMGSIQAWQFTQKLAGFVFAPLGLILTVIMLIVCAGFRGQPMPDLIFSGITALIWQIVLAALAVAGINITAAILFDRKGNRRRKTAAKPESDNE